MSARFVLACRRVTKPGVSKLSLGAAVLLGACGRTELSEWLRSDTVAASAGSASVTTSAGGDPASAGPGFTATAIAAVTNGGGVTASTSGTSSTGTGATGFGGMTASAGGTFGMGGAGGEAPSEIEIEPDTLVPGRYKLEYGASFSASGGSGSYEFRVAAGELPPGLVLASDGALTGTPSFPGRWLFTIEVSDGLGARGQQEYSLEIERNSLVALTVFQSSSSTRSDALLIDLTQPEDGVLHRQEYSRYPQFSPDGRWLKWSTFDASGTTDSYAQPLVDRTPLEQLPLTEDGTSKAWCAWSPDSKRLGCTLSSDDASFELGVRSVTDTSIEGVVPVAEGTSDHTQWISPTRIVYKDSDAELFVADVGNDVVKLEQYLQSLRDEAGQMLLVTDYGAERAVVHSVDASPQRTFVVDLTTETWHELSLATYWMLAPELDLMLGWEGALHFMHAMEGMELLGPLDTSGAGSLAVEASGQIALAPTAARFVAVRAARAIVSSVVGGELENVEVTGAYGSPQIFRFSPDGRWLALATDTELWLTDLGAGDGPADAFAAVKLSDVERATVVFAPDSSALAFISAGVSNPIGGPPVTLGVVDLTQPPEFATRLLETDDEWSWPTWSNDASYLFFLGGSLTAGRALHVYDLLEPDSPRRLIVSCDVPIGASPGCPNGVEFQPWVSWLASTQPSQ